MTERGFQRQVVSLARLYGWLAYHTYDSRKSHPGFPDLVLVRDRVLFVELKVPPNQCTTAQRQWLDALRLAGADAREWTPADWPEIEATLGGG